MKKFNKRDKKESNNNMEVRSIDFGNTHLIAHNHSAEKASLLASGVAKQGTLLDNIASIHHRKVVVSEVEHIQDSQPLHQALDEAREVLQEWFNETNLGVFLQEMNMGMGNLYHHFLDAYHYNDAPWKTIYISHKSFKKTIKDIVTEDYPQYSSYLK